eukprot:scaffold1726_cov260-Pinguiococcus_pyrenoidosus.AAC.20
MATTHSTRMVWNMKRTCAMTTTIFKPRNTSKDSGIDEHLMDGRLTLRMSQVSVPCTAGQSSLRGCRRSRKGVSAIQQARHDRVSAHSSSHANLSTFTRMRLTCSSSDSWKTPTTYGLQNSAPLVDEEVGHELLLHAKDGASPTDGLPLQYLIRLRARCRARDQKAYR